MALLIDVLSNLGKSTGANLASDAMKALLSHPEISKIDVPEEFWSQVNKGLLTKEQAKNDSEISGHYFSKWANTADTVLDEALATYAVDSQTAQSIKSEDGVYKRYLKLTEAVRDMEAKKAATTPTGKKEADEEIRKLNAEIAKIQNDYREGLTKKEKELKDQFHSQLRARDYDQFLDQFEFGLGELPRNIQKNTAKLILDSEIEKQKYKVDYDPDKSFFGLKTPEGMDVYNENRALVSFKDFASKVFAENKLLKVGGAPQGGQPNTSTNGQAASVIVQTGGQRRDTSAFDAAIKESLKDLSVVH